MEDISLIFIFIIILILIIVIIGIIGWVIVKVKTAKTQIQLAEADIDRKKLELVMKRAMIEDLRNASVMLSDRERKQLDAIQADTSILSRKVLYSMNEVEDRTKRLELGSNLGRLNLTLGKIKNYENKLFGYQPTTKRRKVTRR
jgi:biopolymer transport protein ExbB/TolQ